MKEALFKFKQQYNMAKKHEDIELEIEETLEEPLRDDLEEQEAAVETEEQ